jgi:serine phosphatase RsbU (regulator of sigma subunit)
MAKFAFANLLNPRRAGFTISEKFMAETMQCLEVWGGNLGVEEHFHRPGLDVWVYSRPHENAVSGGDVYYLSSCASGRISRMLLADVSGHGPQVSGLARRLRDLMRRHINSISQARFVEGMNQEFVEMNQEDCFATAIVATFFASTRSFQLSVAGHPRPLLYRRKTGRWGLFEFDPQAAVSFGLRNIPLGISESVAYGQTRLELHPGDMMLAYTDGVTEARVSEGQLLGAQGLLNLVQKLDVTQTDRLLQSLLTALRDQATAPFDDDLSLLLACADGSRVGWWNTILAPLRLLRQVTDKSRLD